MEGIWARLLSILYYICIVVGEPIIKRGWYPMNGLNSPDVYVCLQPGPEYPNVINRGLFFVWNDLRWEVIVRVVDISGIFDDHCLSFLLIICNIIRC